MQRLLNRIAWNNLPLRLKTGLIFVMQIVLVAVMALASFVALNTVSTAVSDTVATIVQLRSLSQDIQLKIDEMNRLEESLHSNFLETGFDPTTTIIPQQYSTLISEVQDDATQMQSVGEHLGGPIAPTTFDVQVADLHANLTKSQERFDRFFDGVQQITRPKTGQLAVIETYGKRLEDLTLQRGDPDLIAQVVAIRNQQNALIDLDPTDEERVGLHSAVANYIRVYNDKIPPESQGQELLAARTYDQLIDGVYQQLQQTLNAHDGAQSQMTLLRSSGSRLATLTENQTASPLETLSGILGQARLTLVAGLLIAVVAGSAVTSFFSQNLIQNVHALLVTARRLQSGDLKSRVAVHGTDEFSELGNSFNAMAMQMDSLISGLEQRVAERARDLSITGEIGRAVVALPDPRDLMNEIVELIRQRFGFYHAQIFLVDDRGENAVLVASTGTAGRELLSRRHFLAVGSQSVIGQVTARGEPVIASDTDVSAVHKRNELLPDTRSEMALPMRIGDRVIGALDVQSIAPNAFEADSVAVFQIMAEQLAMALENARLVSHLREAEEDLEAFSRRVTREAWQAYGDTRPGEAPPAFQFSEDKIEPHLAQTPPALSDAIASGRLVATDSGGDDIGLAVPIRVRGEVIGAFGFGGEALHNLTEDDITLVEAVVDRVGLALENIRLVEQSSRRAEHEQIVNEITSKIVGSTDINYILQTTVKELGRVLRAPQTSVQLRREKTDNQP